MNQKITKTLRISGLTIFTFLICLCTYQLCYFIAEKYFFDKIFYQKSVSHGYWPANSNVLLSNFGDRSKDLIALENSTLTGNLKKYNIVVIGDSHVWGQGVRNEQRFTKLLENKLNKIRPTRVYSFGNLGSNVLDYLQILNNTLPILPANLYIVIPVTNDAFVNNNNLDSPILVECQKKFPTKKPLLYLENFSKNNSNPEKYITGQIEASWNNPINLCTVSESIKLFPNNTIFLIDKDYQRDNLQIQKYRDILSQNNQYQISTEVGKFMNKYKKYFTNRVYENFIVSKNDPHPNALANQMYTDIIFNEIISNPRWNFIDEK